MGRLWIPVKYLEKLCTKNRTQKAQSLAALWGKVVQDLLPLIYWCPIWGFLGDVSCVLKYLTAFVPLAF